MNRLLLRALVAFLALPGMVAFAVPLLLIAPSTPVRQLQPWGLGPLGLGVAVLLLTVREFYVAGRGTLVPGRRRGRSSRAVCIAIRATRCTSASC
jgi:hypothetical protein